MSASEKTKSNIRWEIWFINLFIPTVCTRLILFD